MSAYSRRLWLGNLKVRFAFWLFPTLAKWSDWEICSPGTCGALAEAKAVLRQIEPIFRGNGVSKVCPICKWPKVGHAPDCRLAKAIAE